MNDGKKRTIKRIIQRCGCDKILPLTLVYIFYLILHGHLSPGGGFQGGVLMVAVVILIYLGHGYDVTLKSLRPGFLHHSEGFLSFLYIIAALLGVVYLGNFLGALTLSWICANFGWLDAGDGALGAYTMQLAVGKMTMPFGKAFFMGVLCNILVTVAVLASLSAKDAAGRILGAWAPVMFFVVAGFSHSIADMTYCALALFGKSAPACAAAAQAAGADLSVLTWGRYFLGNMLPVTLGNTAGGVLVGLAAWYCYLRKKG